MGDEELNFTEQEARGWANDPLNQARSNHAAEGVVAVCFLLLVALIGFALATGSGGASSGGVTHGQETNAAASLVR